MSEETGSGLNKVEETKKRLDQVSDAFCLAKWYQATLHLHNGNTQSCHHVGSHKVHKTDLNARGPMALHNTPEKKLERAQMRKGQKPAGCEYCWKLERQGELSDRTYKSAEDWSLPFLEETAGYQSSQDVLPKYLELAFDNVCNFKCMYCSPLYSSSWEAEIKKHGPYPTTGFYNNLSLFKFQGRSVLPDDDKRKYIDAFWDWWPQLKNELIHLRVTGGEPLLTEETWRLLEELKNGDFKSLNFAINSNLGLSSKIMGKFVDSLNHILPNVKSVLVYASIDTAGRQAEYIRNGLSEEQFFANLETLLRETNGKVVVSLMITVNALSIFGLKGLMKKVEAMRRKYPEAVIAFDTPYLRNPEHLCLHILPSEMYVYVQEAVNFLKQSDYFSDREVNRLERLLSLMKNNPWSKGKLRRLREDFYKFIKEHDLRRKTDFLATFPELNEFWQEVETHIGRWSFRKLTEFVRPTL
jgi:organic radical activating enzyme